MNGIRLKPEGNRFFGKPEYLGVKVCTSLMIQHLDMAILSGLNTYNITKSFPLVGGYIPEGIACHYIVAMVSLCTWVVITTHPAL